MAGEASSGFSLDEHRQRPDACEDLAAEQALEDATIDAGLEGPASGVVRSSERHMEPGSVQAERPRPTPAPSSVGLAAAAGGPVVDPLEDELVLMPADPRPSKRRRETAIGGNNA